MANSEIGLTARLMTAVKPVVPIEGKFPRGNFRISYGTGIALGPQISRLKHCWNIDLLADLAGVTMIMSSWAEMSALY